MGNYEQLQAAIEQVIKTNGNNEITGQILQNTLKSIVTTVGENATFAGIATPDTNPGTPDQNIFYIATQDGIYTNFGGATLENNTAILVDTSGTWEMKLLNIATKKQMEEISLSQYVTLGQGYEYIDLTLNGKIIKTPLGAQISEEDVNNFGSVKTQCAEGDLFFISCYGGASGFSYAFVDSTNTVIECNGSLELLQAIVRAPHNAAFIVANNAFNGYNPYPVVLKIGYKTINNGFVNLSWYDVQTPTENVGIGEIGYNSTSKELLINTGNGMMHVNYDKNALYLYYGAIYKETDGELTSVDILELKQYTFKSPVVVTDLEIGDLLYSAYRSRLYRKESDISVSTIPFSENVIYKYNGFYFRWDADSNRLIPNNYYGSAYLRQYANTLTTDGMNLGDICYNSSTKKLRIYIGAAGIVGGDGFDDIPYINGGIYSYNGKIYYYNGTELAESNVAVIPNVVLLKKFAQQFARDDLNIGDVCFNSSSKLLRRFVGEGVTPNGFDTVPFDSSTLYLYNGMYYHYDGSTLIPISYDGNFRELSKKCSFIYTHNRVLLSGASIACDENGFFEYACSKMGIQGTNISIPSVNIMWLANELYSNGSQYNEQDVLLLSHTHNYDVFSLPQIAQNWSVADYESYIIPYTGNSTVGGQPTYGNLLDTEYTINGQQVTFTEDEIYALGFDYVIKKWSQLCYSLKDTEGYNSLYGKPIQIGLFTFWHDGRPTYNMAIRKLALKWNIPLITDDEQIGFTKDIKNPMTNNSYSLLYISSEWSGTYTLIEYPGQEFATHPYKVKETPFWTQWETGDMQLSYLPYIQQKRAQILISAIKSEL